MMLQTFIVLLFAWGVLCDPEDCAMQETIRTCDRSLLPKDYPDTVEELRQICSNLKIHMNCMLQVFETCGLEDHVEEMHKARIFFNSICDEDSTIYKVIANNLECISPAARIAEDACTKYYFTEDNKKEIESKEEEISNNYENIEVYKCLSPLWSLTCRSTVIGHRCGSEVKQVVKKILTEFRSNPVTCKVETLEELQPLRETYETVIEKERKLRNLF